MELSSENPIGWDKVEEKLQKALEKIQKKEQPSSSAFPNLQYPKPKYENIGTLLEFVEAQEDAKDKVQAKASNPTGPVKIIILNFND